MTAIVILNYLKNYFLTPRQFLIFLPLIVFFSAQAMKGLVRYAARWAAARLQLAESHVNLLLQAITVVALVLLCVPALGLYYAGDKGDAAGKAQRLAQLWRPGEIILVWPDYNIDVYAYYLDQLNADPVTEALRAIDWQEAEDWLAAPESKYLITAFPLPADRLGQIAAAGMEPLIVPGQASRYTQAVWWKPPD